MSQCGKTEKIILGKCKIIDGKKFMWDGINYESNLRQKKMLINIPKDRFETKLIGRWKIFCL